MADGQATAQPCSRSKKPSRRRAGKSSFGDRRPGLAAIASGQQHAGARVGVGMGEPARRPTDLRVEEADGPQRAGDADSCGCHFAAVVGVPNHAPVAHRPTMLGIDEAHVVEPRVVGRGIRVAETVDSNAKTSELSMLPSYRLSGMEENTDFR